MEGLEAKSFAHADVWLHRLHMFLPSLAISLCRQGGEVYHNFEIKGYKLINQAVAKLLLVDVFPLLKILLCPCWTVANSQLLE